MMRHYDELRARAEAHGQGHVFRWWDELGEHGRATLLAHVAEVDFGLLDRLIEEHLRSRESDTVLGELTPAEAIPLPSTPGERAAHRRAAGAGEKLLRAGEVAALVVAGGQGTRLGYDWPKGMFPAGPITGKSLFQLHAEKILATRRRCEAAIPWYIMTSEANDATTRQFFADRGFFGLPSDDVFFFQQGMMPAVGLDGKLLLASKGSLARSANGHGGTLAALGDSGALGDMRRRGIRVLSYFQVDNPLVKVLDPPFIGYHAERRSEFSSKALRKRDPEEGLGAFCYENGKLRVVEYSDVPRRHKCARREDGSLLFEAGSIAIHAISVDFVEHILSEGAGLPYHRARKTVPCIDAEGRSVESEEPNGVKFEMFIFDALAYADRPLVMMTERAEEFAPIKNADGKDSPATARRAQVERFACWLEAAGAAVPRDDAGRVEGVIEISALYADSAEALRERLPPSTELRGQLNLQ